MFCGQSVNRYLMKTIIKIIIMTLYYYNSYYHDYYCYNDYWKCVGQLLICLKDCYKLT